MKRALFFAFSTALFLACAPHDEASEDSSDAVTASPDAGPVDVWSDNWCGGNPMSGADATALLGGATSKKIGTITMSWREQLCVPDGKTQICEGWHPGNTSNLQVKTRSSPQAYGDVPNTLSLALQSNGAGVVLPIADTAPIGVRPDIGRSYEMQIKCDSVFGRATQTCAITTPVAERDGSVGGDDGSQIEIEDEGISSIYQGPQPSYAATLHEHCFRMPVPYIAGSAVPGATDGRFIARQLVLTATF